MVDIDLKLKKGFRELFPDYARQLNAAKSQAEVEKLHQKFIQEARKNLAKALNKDVSELEVTDETACIPLKQEQYEILKDAKGNVIKSQLHVIVDGLARLKGMEKDEPGLATAQLLVSGVLGLGAIATAAVGTSLLAGAVPGVAALAGVAAITVSVLASLAGLVIVSILIPILYFMKKPASCIVLLINELDAPLVFENDYNVSGKPMLMTSEIPRAIEIPGAGTYPVAGLIATEKKENAFIGSQYGFTMQYKDQKLSFGVECPLTSIMTDNNCYCAIDESAEDVADKTEDENEQFWTTSKDGITLSVRCNSGSGSIAYYIARAYKS